MLRDNPVFLLALLTPVLAFFLYQFVRILERFARRPGGRRLDVRQLLALIAAALLLVAGLTGSGGFWN